MLKTILKQTNKETDRENPRTNGKSKAVQTKSHTEAYTYTLIKREKGEKKYISLLPMSTSPVWDDSLSVQVFYRCRYIKLIEEIQSAAPEAAGRDFPFSSLFAQLLVFSFGFGSASACRSPEGVCSSLTQDGVKGAADSGALAHSGRGGGGGGG